MSRVEKNVEGNEISCFSINYFNIYPKMAQQNFQSHFQFSGLKLWPSHDNSKENY